MIVMNTSYTLIEELNVNSDLSQLSIVENLIDRVCNNVNVVNEYGNVLIAVTEAFNNAVLHGNKNINNGQVYIKVLDGDHNFVFQIDDEGKGFDFNNLPDPTQPENIEKENGRGIFLMRSLAEDVVFENNGSRVKILFNK